MIKRLILIAVMSCAWKSKVMWILEDMGYHCIDQLHSPILKNFVEWLKTTDEDRYQNIALSTNIIDLPAMYRLLNNSGLPYRSLFLDASDEQLVLRYKFTKHKHPMLLLGKASTLEEAIAMERAVFAGMEEFNGMFIDTSSLNHIELKQKMEGYFTPTDMPKGMTLSFISFGYKYGIPKDADLLFDVRFLPNPYWESGLRNLSGNDQEVYDYVMNAEMTKEYMNELCGFLDKLFPRYENEGRNHMVIGVGCTGGHHRSVAVVNYLCDHYVSKYRCLKEHRHEKEQNL